MKRPSGDQTGLEITESTPETTRTGAPPSAGTLNSGFALPSVAAMATHLPSGDQLGAPRTSSESSNPRALVPSAAMTCRCVRPRLRTRKQIRPPSGDTAGAPGTDPSAPFHNSDSTPSLIFHRASAAPFEPTYRTES